MSTKDALLLILALNLAVGYLWLGSFCFQKLWPKEKADKISYFGPGLGLWPVILLLVLMLRGVRRAVRRLTA